MKRRNRQCFFVTFYLTICLLCTTAGLFLADYNTRTAAEGEALFLVSSAYQNETLTIQTGERVERIFISEDTKTIAHFLHNTLPAPLQIWELFARGISKIFA